MATDPSRPTTARPSRRFRDTAIASGLLTAAELDPAEEAAGRRVGERPGDAAAIDAAIADVLVEQSSLTRFQADQMLLGRSRLTLGQYVIVDQLGHGGMGQVFEAKHRMMGRHVAVKVLPKAKWTPETEAQFRREIEMLGRLDHDNLVHAHDANFDAGVYYLVTELVPGLDLRRHVRRHGPLDEVMAASVISQAARGLAYAHAAGVVHRDVKPGNILVRDDGRVKVSDLGLAGSLFEGGQGSGPRRISGTMDYMAPEQIRHPERINPSSDIYGLGCTLYFAVTGQVPFPGGTREEKARRQLSEPPAALRGLAPQVSPRFERAIADMMRKDPRDRVASADAVVELLKPWTPAEPVAMLRSARGRGGSVSRVTIVGGVPSESEQEASAGPARRSSNPDAISLEAQSDEGRSSGDSSFTAGQSSPPWILGGADAAPGSPTSVSDPAGGQRPGGRRLPSPDGRFDAISRVLARSAVVGFLFGLAISLLQALFGEAWHSLGLSFLDFWSAGTAAFLTMAIVSGAVAALGSDRQRPR